MTVKATAITGASSASNHRWKDIDWKKVVTEVRRLQMRIAEAYREGKYGKVKSLQWILTHSFSAKLLAVKRVTQNQGAKTPGVDGIIWKTPHQKMVAVMLLKRKGYKTQPLRRIYISKKQKGKRRPLSIPSMLCRGQQALHLLSLEPISEMMADKCSYGFRPLRSTADAIEQCFKILAKEGSAQYILEGDIENCFCAISHQWLLNNVPMDKKMLKKWLAAGYVEKGEFYPTERGTPQGSIISPTLLNITLSGMETFVKKKVSYAKRNKVYICTYADDFIITGVTKEVLENKVKPAVESFLQERGLTLSKEKTKITHINEGFDFLGMSIRKYKRKLIIKPAKSSVKRFLHGIKGIVKKNATARTENLIRPLNQKIQGWTNYYRHICAKRTFRHVDKTIFSLLWQWSKRRHNEKGLRWIKKKYYRQEKGRNWIFFAQIKDKCGNAKYLDLIEANKTPIKRHIKIRAEATPYDPIYHEYLDKWLIKRGRSKSRWEKTWWDLLQDECRSRAVNDGLTKARAV